MFSLPGSERQECKKVMERLETLENLHGWGYKTMIGFSNSFYRQVIKSVQWVIIWFTTSEGYSEWSGEDRFKVVKNECMETLGDAILTG